MVVLEARDRVGGRTLNAEIGDGEIVEMGGQWIGPTQERIAELAGELGVETFPTHPEGANLLRLDGRLRALPGHDPAARTRTVLLDIARTLRKLNRARPGRSIPRRRGRRRGAAELDRESLAEWLRPDDAHRYGEAVDAHRRAHDLGRRARGAVAASRRLLPAIGRQLRAAHRRRGRRPAGSFRRRLAGDRDPRRRRARRTGRPRCCGSADRAERGRRRRRDGSRPGTRAPRDRRDSAGADRPDRVRAAATAGAASSSPSAWRRAG